MENICRESFKIINYLAQSAEPDPGLRYCESRGLIYLFEYSFILLSNLSSIETNF
jgi:hypothetical protein